jgi:ATP:ADP antiporter, AAA family
MTKFLQRFTNVQRDEVVPLLLAALYFFCILTALMTVRPAREALGMQRGMDAVRWLFNLTLIATLLVSPLFGILVSRFRRIVFVGSAYAFFAANLLVFWALLVFTPDAIGQTVGQVFYVWFSVFNLFVTMLFWAVMADIWTLEQSKRLFGVIAVGGTVGAITGPLLTISLVDALGTPALLLVAAGFLLLAVGVAITLIRIRPIGEQLEGRVRGEPVADEKPIGGSAWEGLKAVVRSPYLLGISTYVLILAVLVTFLYFTRLQMVADLGEDVDMRTGVFARLDLLTQSATLILQLIVTGHLMKRLGVAVTLALLPAIVALGYLGLAAIGTLVFLAIFQAVFSAVQRAVMRPARETLFTVVSREDKYKAKSFIDTFVYRAGDATGAQTEGLLGRLGMGLGALAAVAVPLCIVWGAVGLWLGGAQSRIAARKHAADGLVEDDRATVVK